MFGWEFPPHISGGLGTACHGLTKGLYANGKTDVIFVVPKAFGDEDNQIVKLVGANDVLIGPEEKDYSEYLKKIKMIEVASNLVPYTSPEEYEKHFSEKEITSTEKKAIFTKFGHKINFTGGYSSNLFQEISNYAIVAGTIASENDFDVIHAHDWLTYPAGIAAKQISGKPLVVHVHATDFDRSGGSVNPDVYALEREGIQAADKVITVSNLTRNIVINNYGADPEKVTTIYNAVEPGRREELKAEKGITDKIVTFLGRITMQKGPGYFIEAANRVLQTNNNVRFVMAGNGELLESMISRVAQLRIGDKFHFTGFLKGRERDEMYQMSDVYVMPSVSEPFGISPLEAMQLNVPVIISKQSGVSEILKHAIKIDFWDIDAMADAINALVSYEGLSYHFKYHGIQEVENISWRASAAKLESVYHELIQKK